ncbi:MAG: putative glycerol-3-phosphate acyltransferase [Hyphomicrobiaceae bacterium hypho_1]
MDYLTLLASIALAYLIGSIPSGYILTKMLGFGDIRQVGSGNIGATNVLRTGNKLLALATLVADLFKGIVSVWLSEPIVMEFGFLSFRTEHITGLAVILGHLYPVWLGFKGGKGVATSIGVFSGILWQAGLVFCCVWIATAIFFRYSSLSALVASTVALLVSLIYGDGATRVLFFVLNVLLFLKHRSNICRLLNGQEPKIRLT